MTKPRILVVEDEPSLRMGLVDGLLSEGFEVEECADGKSGLDAAMAQPFDALVLDLMLPKERLDSPLKDMSVTRRWRWKMLQLLRCPPPLASYAGETRKSDASIMISDIRPRSLSSLDRHVLRHYPAGKAEFIRSLMSKTLIAQRYALGFIALVNLADWMLRLLLLAIYFKVQASYSRLSNASTNEAVVLAAATLFTGSLIHIWSFVKG